MKKSGFLLLCLLSFLYIANFSRITAIEAYAAPNTASGGAVDVSAVSAVLIEGSTGETLFEKDKDKELVPASITKIMTLNLIFEAIDSKKISLDDMVTVSEYAASMGGSQVFLEPNESQTVNDMIKCISIASANDAAVAMAEKIAGSEEAFVKQMNEKAKALGMKHTQFKNCTGLGRGRRVADGFPGYGAENRGKPHPYRHSLLPPQPLRPGLGAVGAGAGHGAV